MINVLQGLIPYASITQVKDMNVQRKTHTICLLASLLWLASCGQSDGPPAGESKNSNKVEPAAPAFQIETPAEPANLDSDSDGVPDSIDQCGNSAAGAAVDSRGCERDSDGDQVVDSVDECRDTAAGVDVDPHGCPSLALDRKLIPNVPFASGSTTLERSAVEAELAELLNLANTYSTSDLRVTGFTDDRGSEEANRSLSKRRAQTVADLLVELGLDAQRISAIGKGEEDPIADNNSAAGRAQNRRIEITLLAQDQD